MAIKDVSLLFISKKDTGVGVGGGTKGRKKPKPGLVFFFFFFLAKRLHRREGKKENYNP